MHTWLSFLRWLWTWPWSYGRRNGNRYITFVDDEGNDVRFEILDVVTLDEKEYLVVLPVDETDSGVLILEIKQEDGEEVYDTVTDDAEAERVFNKFQEEYGSDDEEDEE